MESSNTENHDSRSDQPRGGTAPLVAFVLLVLCFVYGWATVRDTSPANTKRSKRALSTNSDIYAIWLEGQRVCRGENPYSRTVAELERQGRVKKPPSYLPGFYLVACAMDRLGSTPYAVWWRDWGRAALLLHIALAALIAGAYWRRGLNLPALLVGAVMLYGFHFRHTLFNLQINTLALLPLVGSLLLWHQRRTTSLLLFGISLSIKQFAIFLLPLYLAWSWNERRNLKRLSIELALIALIPAVLIVPFLIDDPQGVTSSLLTSAVRSAPLDRTVPGLKALIPLPGASGAFTALLLLSVVALALRYPNLPRAASSAIMLGVFCNLHTVLFPQYLLWPLTLLLLIPVESHPLPTRDKDRVLR